MQNFHGAVEGFHVKTVDTTGAGDSFVGALLCKIVDDQSVLEVSRYHHLVIIIFTRLKGGPLFCHLKYQIGIQFPLLTILVLEAWKSRYNHQPFFGKPSVSTSVVDFSFSFSFG